ncbi:MAG: hypothetical protein KBB24_02005 [Bacteroidales bacterium]|jgi:hypothetical protein|nr:hypothetical protein [Bacteroidales bacterium]MDX9927585.1 hypothetical protein [Bacteroidales bacterium]HNX82827.1 hypothetical protein [Bacteroidales bacterium]HOC47697.1 hypothetical protein [Bacteroidales bacterium]HPS96606.1 hypothetical protein [Bacteroidales bacterium]
MKAEKRIVVTILMLMTVVVVVAQDGSRAFGEVSLAANNAGMYVLGGWALANMAAGAYGWAAFEGEKKYFSQMNLFWNIVNLSIAGFALYSNYSTDLLSLGDGEIMTKHLKTERLFLINSGLDVAYMGAGILMRHLGTGSERRGDLLKGYGNAVILQGGFLLVFDIVMYFIFRDIRPAVIELTSALQQGTLHSGIRIAF